MRTITICSSLAFAFALVACTPLDSGEPSKPVEQNNAVQTSPDPKPIGTPDPTPQPEAVRVAIGSVTLDQDCPDPVVPVSAKRSEAAPERPVPGASRGAPPMPASDAVGGRAFRRACAQSTLQVRFTNEGKSTASVRIASIQLHDVTTKSVLAPVQARLPAVFNETGEYLPWDERIAAGTEFHASYRLTPPDWSKVEAALAGSTSRGRELELEVTAEIDGKPTTVRSPAFSRPPEVIMPAT